MANTMAAKTLYTHFIQHNNKTNKARKKSYKATSGHRSTQQRTLPLLDTATLLPLVAAVRHNNATPYLLMMLLKQSLLLLPFGFPSRISTKHQVQFTRFKFRIENLFCFS